jgi:hypothetical protein
MGRTVGILRLLFLGALLVFALHSLGPAVIRSWGQVQDADDAGLRAPGKESGMEFPVPTRPLPKTITPCSSCHGKDQDFPVNLKRREDLHVHINITLKHGGVRVWCLDCHHPTERDYLLPLSDGKLIPFEQSYLLCGKCHGTKYRDWREGIHGRRTGSWNGRKEYLLCVHCHNPHTPRFRPIRPMPSPQKPWTPRETKAAH